MVSAVSFVQVSFVQVRKAEKAGSPMWVHKLMIAAQTDIME